MARVNIFHNSRLCLCILILHLSCRFGGEVGLHFSKQPYLRQAFVCFYVELLMKFDAFAAEDLFAVSVCAEKLVIGICMF